MLRVHARWVHPITSPPIERGTVAVEGDRIVWVGPRDDAPAGEDLDAGEAILLPGLVNAHTHLELTLLRGTIEHGDFPRWIWSLIEARRGALSESHLHAAACRGIAEGVRAGVTTFGDTSDSGVSVRALREMGVRGIVYQEVFGPDPSQCADSMRGLREKLERHRSVATDLVSVGVSPHAPFSVSDDLFTAAAAYARSERLPVAIHIAESVAETMLVTEGRGPFADALRRRGIGVAPRGRSPIAMLDRLGVLGEDTLLIHCVSVDDADIAALARHGCSVAHCPASNAKLGHGIAPLAELIAHRVNVGLGSDSMASNNRMDILEEARMASLLQRARSLDGGALPAQAALELATIGGARALRLEREIGSLEEGKAADLVAFALDGATASQLADPATAAVFSLTGRDASLVMVAGRMVARDGALVMSDAGWHADALDGERALSRWREARARASRSDDKQHHTNGLG